VTAMCPKCAQQYEFATIRLKGKDRMARCSKCGCRFPVHLPARGTVAAGLTRVGKPARSPADAAPAPHVRIALTALGGSLKDETFLIARSPTVIGRSEGEVRVPDPAVSGRHAQVELSGGEAWLRDLGSTNGTFVNGKRIERVRLKHMDEITVGATRLLYTYIEDLVSVFEAFSPES